MQRQQDELEGFPKSTLVWLGARHQGRVCFKGNAEESVFVAAPMHLTVCISLPLCLCSVPTPTRYPSTPISVIFSSQNGMRPICLATVENPTPSHLDMALTCTDNFLSLSAHITNTSGSAERHRAQGLKGMREKE